MPRTTDRSGATLNAAAIDAMFANDQFDVAWSIRFVDTGGTWTSSSGWTYYDVPDNAVISRSRQATLDGGPWHCTLTLLAEEIPLANVPKAYYRVEIDRIIGPTPPNAWPYFTGIVDKVTASWAIVDGAVVQTYEVECFGVSQRLKGWHVDFLEFLPASGDDHIYQAIGICKEVRGSFSASGPSTSQAIPDSMVTYDIANLLVLSPNADFSSPYTRTTHYTVGTSTFPALVSWTGSGPALDTTVYYKYQQFQYAGIRRRNFTTFFRTPYGRDHRDLFYTEVSSYDSGAVTITPKDPIPYDSDYGLLNPWTASGSTLTEALDTSELGIDVDDGTDFRTGDLILIDSEVMHIDTITSNTLTVTRGFDGTTAATHSLGATVKRGQYEYLLITDSDGTESIREISSVSAAGVITLASAPSFTPVAGDPIKVVSTEIYSAWEEFGQRTVINSEATLAEDLDATETVVTVSDGTKFAENNVIKVGLEDMLVTSISSNDLTVQRSYNGLTFTHTNGDTINKRTVNGDHQSQIRVWFGDYRYALTANATAAATTLSVTNGFEAHIAVGDTILINAEMMRVSAVDTGADTITVERGFNGCTATSHSSGAIIYEEFQRHLFTVHPDSGIIVCTGNHFTATNVLLVTASPILGSETNASVSDRNRVEEALKSLLAVDYRSVTGLGAFANNDILTYASSGATHGPTGAYVKNILRHQIDLGEWTQEFKNGAMPPNCYIRDERDGKLSIRPYSMASAPDLTLKRLMAIQQESDPEPSTAVVVISEQAIKPVNMAPSWFYALDDWTDDTQGQTFFNRRYDSTLAQNAATRRAYVSFKIPGVSPAQAFPVIESLKVYGAVGGVVTIRVATSTKSFYPPEATYMLLKGVSNPLEISGDILNRAVASLSPTSDWYLYVELYADNSSSSPGTAGAISEIEIWVKQTFAWRAELSDDSTKLASAYQPTSPTTQFGNIFVMTDPGSSVGAGDTSENLSRIWAPSALLKRIAPKYNSSAASIVHRIKRMVLPDISLHDCRTLAEDYLLEETYKATPYVITCLLDDRIEIGDTIAVPWPDDSVKLLFVEGISDQGGYSDNVCQITATDRSTTNRVAA